MNDMLRVSDDAPGGLGDIPPRPKRGPGRLSDERKATFEREAAEWDAEYGERAAMASPAQLVLPSAKVSGPAGRAKPKKNVDAIKKILISLHAKGAAVLNAPELEIDDEEAQSLAESGAVLAEYYKIKLDGKKGAWMGFIYALSLVYGPRAVMTIAKIRIAKLAENGNA